MAQNHAQEISRLRRAYKEEGIALYLCAGISVGSGLPTWEQLVLAMYFSVISDQKTEGPRPFPNYLFAIAEWHLERYHEPLDITARKIRHLYPDQQEFLHSLKQTLYGGFRAPGDVSIQIPRASDLRHVNRTLNSVVQLCANSGLGARGVEAVITYNYDHLLEFALEDVPCQPIWKSHQTAPAGKLPVYHVHGYIPIEMEEEGSTPEEVVFTEEQYHLAAQDSYSWANLIQIKCLCSSVGLMIGLSLADRNMCRLLDAIRKAPVRLENYALLPKPRWAQASDQELAEIAKKATGYYQKFERSGIKTWDQQFMEINDIIRQVEELDLTQQTSILEELGVHPLWYHEHTEIPDIISRVLQSE
jgi:hypothetical protein